MAAQVLDPRTAHEEVEELLQRHGEVRIGTVNSTYKFAKVNSYAYVMVKVEDKGRKIRPQFSSGDSFSGNSFRFARTGTHGKFMLELINARGQVSFHTSPITWYGVHLFSPD